MLILCLTLLLTAAAPDQLTPEQRLELARYFGFGEMQIYNFKRGASILTLADADGDQKTDIAVWDPSKSRLELFVQADAEPRDLKLSDKPNALRDRGTLRRVPVPVSGRVADFAIAELTSDKYPDIVYFGEPREIVVLPGEGSANFGTPRRMRAPEGRPRSGSLVTGDFNNDDRTDVLLFGDAALLLYYQQQDGGLAPAEKIAHDLTDATFLLVADVDGDQRDDLLIARRNEEYAAALYRQELAGGLGPRERLALPELRSLTVANRADGPADVLSIETVTERLKLYKWDQAKTTGLGDWPMHLYAYPDATDSNQRAVAKGDINADGFVDFVAATPDGAQLIAFLGMQTGMQQGVTFPGLVETSALTVADLDGDGRAEVLSLSREEKKIGIARFENERLTFPTTFDVEGEPLQLAAGIIASANSQRTALVVLTEREVDDERINELNVIDAQRQRAPQTITLERLRENPNGIMLADVNQDGLTDILVLIEFDAMRTYIQHTGGAFEPLATAGGTVRDAKRINATLADVDDDGKPEFVLARGAFARAMRVEADAWRVIDQYNAESRDATLEGITTTKSNAGKTQLLAYDARGQRLLVWERGDKGAYRVAQRMPVGNFDVQLLAARGGPSAEVWLAGIKKLAVLTPAEQPRTLVEQQTYETEAEEATLADSIVGDINGDGVRDVILLDTQKAAIEVLTTLPSGALANVLRFQVFQGKRFSADPDAGGEPRSGLVGDVTGDGIDDIVLLVHDRLIIYPGQ